MEWSGSDRVHELLDGAVTIREIRHPDRAFALEATLDLVKGARHFEHKPFLHFHANQDEYIQATEGKTVIEIHGTQKVLSPGEGEFTIKAWESHRSYPLEAEKQDGITRVKFILSGAKTLEPYEINLLFFENWYKYQDHVVRTGGKIDLIQVLSTFDGAGTYIAPPSWLPLGRRISQILGIVVGRWFGSLLGYQPFYREFSTNWELACKEMETSIFHRRFATHPKVD